MLSVMEIGPYIGVMLDGSTAHYYDVEKGVNMDRKICGMCGCCKEKLDYKSEIIK